MLRATVSGSFHRHMDAITSAVYELIEEGVRVLSPADPRVVDADRDFLFVASDRVRSIRLVQDRHLEAIRSADFLWLVCPDGYVGQSAAMEIGFAAGAGIPIYATNMPLDLTLREYIKPVASLSDAVKDVDRKPHYHRRAGLLIDPQASIECVHDVLASLASALRTDIRTEGASRDVHKHLTNIQDLLKVPTQIN